MIQRNLRPPGGKGYAIPRGFGFDYITCANYTFEIYGWILFAAATWTLPALIFIAAGAGQMAIWAKAKHMRLRKVCAFSVPAPKPTYLFQPSVAHVQSPIAECLTRCVELWWCWVVLGGPQLPFGGD